MPFLRPSLPALEDYEAELRGIWDSRMLSNFGSAAQRFESLCRDYGGWAHAACAANGDLALTLAIAALELPEGSRALVPSFTFNSTLHAVLWNRLEPCFVDVDPDTFCLRPEAVAGAIRDGGADLVVATHVFGTACEAGELERLAAEAGAALVFDAAHAFATFVDGRHVGTFGQASTFSFSGTKLVTAGEGGVAAFPEPEIDDRFRHLRGYGFRRDYVSRYVGLNAKLSELHAALGCLTVPRIEEEVAARAAVVHRYRERLDGTPGVRFQADPPGVRPSRTYLAIDVGERRDALAAHLAAQAIETKAYFRPLHEMPRFARVERCPLEVTEALGRGILCLPLFAALEPAAAGRVASEVAAFLAS